MIFFVTLTFWAAHTEREREREKEKSVILQYVVIYERQKEKKTK